MLKALRGTKDILSEDVVFWQYIESCARNIFSKYNYKEIRTPIIEEAGLFIRGIGEASDIVQKEMYIFSDRGERSIALRPEATASIVRAYLENSIGAKESLSKLFYIGPMFRSERPQKGRQRQFHQIGVEAIGSDNPFIDAEVIALAVRILEFLGIKEFTVKINSLGCHKDKEEMINKCRKTLKPRWDSLCPECKSRFNKNVLRIFDCKNKKCKELVEGIVIKDVLCDDCTRHFDTAKRSLEMIGISYTVDSKIVRGLDYYTKTVFEITQKDLGAKDAVCAGGRYNNLIEEMGGNPTPAVGFAFGVERVMLSVKEKLPVQDYSLDAFIAVLKPDFYEPAFKMLNDLRGAGFSCDIDYENKSLKAQMRKAEKLNSGFVVMFGEEEFIKGKVSLRDMRKREQREVGLGDIIRVIAELIGNR